MSTAPHADSHADSHADLDVLADVLADEASTENTTHVRGCPACSARLEELEAAMAPVQAALTSSAVPEIPADLVGRLDAALVAERTATSLPHAVPAGTVTPLGSAASRRTRWLAAASGIAAAAVLVIGAVVFAPGDNNNDAATTEAGAAKAGSIATSSTGSDYAKDGTLLATHLPTLLAGSVAQDARAAPDASTEAGTTLATADPLAPLREPAALATCLAALTDPEDDGVPLALDYAAFEGQPALIVVLPTTRADKVDVFVVGPECNASDQKVLFFTRLTKP